MTLKRINRGKIAEDAHEKLKRSFKDKIDLDLLLQKEKFIDPETHKIKFETDLSLFSAILKVWINHPHRFLYAQFRGKYQLPRC